MKNLIGDSWKASSNSKMVDVYNPATNELLDRVPDSTIDDVAMVVEGADRAFYKWSSLFFNERCNILNKFIKSIDDEKDYLAMILSKETGNCIHECYDDLYNLQVMTSLYIGKAKELYNSGVSNSDGESDSTVKMSIRKAIGVAVVLIPDNAVMYTFANVVPAVLLMGNSCIVKPSIYAPLTVTRLVYLLRSAGVFEGVIQVIHGSGKNVGQALAIHPLVNIVCFNGEVSNAISVMRAASSNLTKTLFDLSSNNAFILFKDGDVDLAVKETIKNRIYHAGQSTTCNKRFLIHKDVKDEYVQKLVGALKRIRVDIPSNRSTDMGCLITLDAALDVEKKINATINEGARLVFGGRRNGAYIEPTVIDGVKEDMMVAKDLEILGPVIPIIEFDNIDDAIRIVNQSIYTQAVSIFTNDMKLAFNVSKVVNVSRVVINGGTLVKCMIDNCEGYRYSGMGMQGVENMLKEVSQSKVLIFNDILD